MTEDKHSNDKQPNPYPKSYIHIQIHMHTHTTFILKSEKLRRGGSGNVTAQGRRGNCAYYLQHSQAHTEKQRDTDSHKIMMIISHAA